MGASDFFDDDLLRKRTGTRSRRPSLTVDDGSSALGRHRDTVTNQVSGAAEEIERLRRRQSELEKEREDLETLSQRQEAYEKGKRELHENLSRSIVGFEKQETQSARLVEHYSTARSECKKLLGELEQIHEEEWTEDSFRSNLTSASSVLENARAAYNKAVATVEAAGGGDGARMVHGAEPEPEGALERGFLYWLKVGFAISLPFILMMALLFIAYLVLMGWL
tara:strand:- start:2701 stop:3369 length:669 start_codon:yes stop_codon:yes gene_type:complete